MATPSFDPIFSNVKVYRELAIESEEASGALLSASRRPKDDGTGGYVISSDPLQRSFKHSLVAIVFAGMHMEAQLWLHGCQRLGVDSYTAVDKLPLEQRLAPIGIDDEALVADLKAYRISRKELVHEKARPVTQDRTSLRSGQDEAKLAVAVMLRLERALMAGQS